MDPIEEAPRRVPRDENNKVESEGSQDATDSVNEENTSEKNSSSSEKESGSDSSDDEDYYQSREFSGIFYFVYIHSFRLGLW